MRTLPMPRWRSPLLLCTGALLLCLAFSACAARSDEAPEPRVTVRGQYDVTVGTVR